MLQYFSFKFLYSPSGETLKDAMKLCPMILIPINTYDTGDRNKLVSTLGTIMKRIIHLTGEKVLTPLAFYPLENSLGGNHFVLVSELKCIQI